MIDIVERLRHIDFTFWYAPILPHEKFERIEIGKMSRDAANEIERLREEVKTLRQNKWKPLIKVHSSDFPSDEYYGVPVCVSGNKVWPWLADNVVLYAALKEGE